MDEKLALNDDILMKIEKPARYIGNEVNEDRKSTRLNSSHTDSSRMPSSA